MRLLFLLIFAVCSFAENVDVNLIRALTDTIHSLQEERAAACRFLVHKSDLKSLKKYFLKTEKSMRELNKFNVDKRINQDLFEFFKIRQKLLEEKKCRDVFLGYKNIIADLLSYLAALSEKSKLKKYIYEYSMILMYEETLHQKRLEIAAYIKNENFQRVKDFYLMSSTKEKVYFDVINRVLSKEMMPLWQKYVNSESFKRIRKLEKTILVKTRNGEKPNLDNYVKTLKENIVYLRAIETKLLDVIKAKEKNSTVYTPEEIKFIKKQIPIKYVYRKHWKPFEFQNQAGMHSGMIADILKIVKRKSGLNLVPIAVDNVHEEIYYIKSSKADMISAINPSDKNKEFLQFTKHVILKFYAVIIGKCNKFDLDGKTIGVKGNSAVVKFLKNHYKNIKIIKYLNVKKALNDLKKEKIKFFVVNSIEANYYANQSDMKLKLYPLDYWFKLKIAIRKNDPKIIINILDKTLQTIPQSKIESVYKKWVQPKRQKNEFKFSLPVKELLSVGVLLVLVLFLTYWYVNRQNKITISYNIFVLVGFFVVAIIFITIVTVKNLERIKKAELAYSLQTILKTTHESIKKVLNSEAQLLNILINKGTYDEIKRVQKLNFVTGYIVLDKNYEVLHSTFNIKKISNKNFIEGLKKAAHKGFAIIFPVKNSLKPLHHVFFIKAIYKGNRVIKYVAVALDESFIQSILNKSRLGKSGETYIINKYKELVSKSRFEDELKRIHLLNNDQSSFLNIRVDTLASINALTKHSGVDTQGYIDYRDKPVFGAWEWDNDFEIAIITEINKHEAMNSFIKSKTTIYYALFIVVAFIVILMAFIVWISNKSKKALEKKNEELRRFNEELEELVLHRTKSLEEAKKEIEEIHNKTKDSIEFASLIQKGLIPSQEEVDECFDEFFVIWKPKDIVGGDIWLFEKIRDDECILMVVDCTGHGVPGAFVTMIVKAIEREVILKYKDHPELEVSPAEILEYFNKTIKKLLKQDEKKRRANVGFDGGVLYYDKKRNLIRYASAKTPLFIVKDDKIEVIKGDRNSIGYKTFKYTDYEIKVRDRTALYISTDGYIDQLGGDKCLPFGKKRFKNIILEVKDLPMNQQKEIFEKRLEEYAKGCDRVDDVTLIGIKIKDTK